MAQRVYFERNNPEELINVSVSLSYQNSRTNTLFTLDTGASHSVLDINVLFLLGFRLHQLKNHTTVNVFTAGGIIEGHLIILDQLTCLGKTVFNFPVFVYDFLSIGSTDDAEGMIGLDFLVPNQLIVDLAENYVELNGA